MAERLSPCPFCGEAADAPCGGLRWCVVCNCGTSSGWFETEAEMAKAWNRRIPTPPAGEVERLRGVIAAYGGHKPHCKAWLGTEPIGTCSCGFFDTLASLAAPTEKTERPPVVCLCGSTRFRAEFEQMQRELGLQGLITLTVSCFGHSGDLPPEACQDGHPTKAALDQLHFRKIDLADSIFVIDVAGYIGNSTRNEIAYATAQGKPARYYSQEKGLDARAALSAPESEAPTGNPPPGYAAELNAQNPDFGMCEACGRVPCGCAAPESEDGR